MAELRSERVSFSYPGGQRVLCDVTFSLRSGELVALVGANAGGKTTLLRILAGLIKPRQGDVSVDGASIGEARDRVGLLFQNPDHQMIAATVEEEIALGLELRAVPSAPMREIVEILLSRFDLKSLRHRSPETLSGGQKQRVALAAIMVSRPSFLLLDEPDSFLDASSRREFLSGITEVRAECGILWAVPRPSRMPKADRCLVLDAGSVREVARADLANALISVRGCE